MIYYVPEFVINHKMIQRDVIERFTGTSFYRSDTGFVDAYIFGHWMRECFIPEVMGIWLTQKLRHSSPASLIIGPLSCHCDRNILNALKDFNINVFFMTLHRSHLRQFLDLELFGGWKKIAKSYKPLFWTADQTLEDFHVNIQQSLDQIIKARNRPTTTIMNDTIQSTSTNGNNQMVPMQIDNRQEKYMPRRNRQQPFALSNTSTNKQPDERPNNNNDTQ